MSKLLVSGVYVSNMESPMEEVQARSEMILQVRKDREESYLSGDRGEPNYKHDCDECVFLGSIPRSGNGDPIDLWAHWGERIAERTVISRWSNEPSQYQSGIGVQHYSIVEALDRAVFLGVIPSEVLVPVSIRKHVCSGVSELEVFSLVEATMQIFAESILGSPMPPANKIAVDLSNRLASTWQWMTDRRMVDAGSALPGLRMDHYCPEAGEVQVGIGGRRIEPLTQQEIRVDAMFSRMPFFKCDCDRGEDERSVAEDRAVERILAMIEDECEGLSLREQKAVHEALRDRFKDED